MTRYQNKYNSGNNAKNMNFGQLPQKAEEVLYDKKLLTKILDYPLWANNELYYELLAIKGNVRLGKKHPKDLFEAKEKAIATLEVALKQVKSGFKEGIQDAINDINIL